MGSASLGLVMKRELYRARKIVEVLSEADSLVGSRCLGRVSRCGFGPAWIR